MEAKVSTRDRIRLAAIEAIEQHGIDQLTTRLIAEGAGTNLASINYHFRTKDDLLTEVLQSTADHMLQDVFAEIEKPDRGPVSCWRRSFSI
jgi:AcrR family transcriptional regulator